MDDAEESILHVGASDYYKFIFICKLLKDLGTDFEVVAKCDVKRSNGAKKHGVGPLHGMDIEIIVNDKDVIPEICKKWKNIVPDIRAEIVENIDKIIEAAIIKNDKFLMENTEEAIFERGHQPYG